MRRSSNIGFLGLILSLALASANASATLLVEPFLSYMPSGNLELSVTGAEPSKEGLSGLMYGARIGYVSMLGIMVGGEYETGALKDSKDPKSDSTPSNLGVFVGYEFPVLLRVWGVYGLKNEVKVKDDTSSETYKDGSKYLKLGVGFTPLPLVSLNLEYVTTEFDLNEPYSGSIKSNGILLGVSLPLRL